MKYVVNVAKEAISKARRRTAGWRMTSRCASEQPHERDVNRKWDVVTGDVGEGVWIGQDLGKW